MSTDDYMEKKIVVDYSDTAVFKGARVFFPFLNEGVEYIKRHGIKDVCVWQGMERSRHTVDFGFFEELGFIERLDWLVPLSKKSSIDGLYSLKKLISLRWAADSDIEIDFSKLETLETLAMNYRNGFKNLGKLSNLKKLHTQSVKTDDLKFLSDLKELRSLRIIRGRFKSLEGLEQCESLEELMLQHCFSLVHAESTLHKLENLKSVLIQGCKKHDIGDMAELKSKIAHVWIG